MATPSHPFRALRLLSQVQGKQVDLYPHLVIEIPSDQWAGNGIWHSGAGWLTDTPGKVCQVDSPYPLSTKHPILGACLSRRTPFRSMLLTPESGLEGLAPKVRLVPVHQDGLTRG